MKKGAAPTNVQNAEGRLFLRFFLFYGLSFVVGILLYVRGARFVRPDAARPFVVFPAALALLGALLTVSGPYLTLLSVGKGLCDAVLLAGVTARVFGGEVTWLPYNGFLLLTLLSCLTFCYAAARACWFAFSTKERDLKLLFSRSFARFLLLSVIIAALLTVIWFLWPHMT